MQCMRLVIGTPAAGSVDWNCDNWSVKMVVSDASVKLAQLVVRCAETSKPSAVYCAASALLIWPRKMYDVLRMHSQLSTEQPTGLAAFWASKRPLVPPG